MGAMFRSEEMALCQMFIQPEAAYQAISELGELGCVQFRDLNTNTNSFKRKFVQEVRRCDELGRKMRYIEKEIAKQDIILPNIEIDIPRAPNPRSIIDLEAQIERTENEILELSVNEIQLKSNFLELTELESVLENTQMFFSDKNMANFESIKTIMTQVDINLQQKRAELGYIAGIMLRERVPAFERMLWRISRGNVLLRRVELDEPFEDPATRNTLYKTVFVVFFQGDELKTRIKKVCAGFHASIYPCPNHHSERVEMIKGVHTRLEDLKMVLNQTEDYRHQILVSIAKELPVWYIMVTKMKAIYHTLNLFDVDVTQKCLIGECWIPVEDVPAVQRILSSGSLAVGSTVPSFLNVIETDDIPPTFNRTNRFTQGFQNLIDAYGVASYREVNPALYTIVTFPFLFGVMFGDFGHGIILTLFGAWMCIYEKDLEAKKISSEIWNIFFGGRYIILLMGIFSMYTGLVYNDILAISMNIFGSKWKTNYNVSTIMTNPYLVLDPAENLEDDTYPLGIDPVWQLATNKIIFLNTFKMKISIIIGVIHMMFGICVGVINHVHLKKHINIFTEFLPQIIFLVLLFGYMVFMMFFKWVAYSATPDKFSNSPGCAPSVLILFISMVLFKEVIPLENCESYMFEGQEILQMVLLVTSLVCIPWMLLAKPIYIMLTRKKNAGAIHRNEDLQPNNADASNLSLAGASHENVANEVPMSEVWINQAIHTIEYALSTVSHTASYLRLWALSLAHAQLSEILWGQVLKMSFMGFGYIDAVILFVIFPIWAFFTLAILVMMEGLSAFLHTLRLHWVEFMSKFYDGLGYVFQPFCFHTILNESEDS